MAKDKYQNRPLPLNDILHFTYFEHYKPEIKSHIMNQLEEAYISIVQNIYSDQCYERKFFKMFKMQINMKQDDFNTLETKFQIRFLCHIFFNFMDKNRILLYFDDFYPQILMNPKYKSIPAM
jgi:hypothetical protein